MSINLIDNQVVENLISIIKKAGSEIMIQILILPLKVIVRQ
jgi:hypothetical protein